MKRWELEGWKEDDVEKLELTFLHAVMVCRDPEAADSTVTFARYLAKIGVNPDTYPIYLKLLDTKNHWVIDALLGDANPEKYFLPVQMNHYIVKESFRALTASKAGSVYPKCLLVYLGILATTYESPLEGYRVYAVSANDMNNLAKHLDEKQDQGFALNRSILYLLDKIASLLDPGNIVDDTELLKVAIQANNIRGKFLDSTKSLREAIPDLLLVRENFADNEVKPTIV